MPINVTPHYSLYSISSNFSFLPRPLYHFSSSFTARSLSSLLMSAQVSYLDPDMIRGCSNHYEWPLAGWPVVALQDSPGPEPHLASWRGYLDNQVVSFTHSWTGLALKSNSWSNCGVAYQLDKDWPRIALLIGIKTTWRVILWSKAKNYRSCLKTGQIVYKRTVNRLTLDWHNKINLSKGLCSRLSDAAHRPARQAQLEVLALKD